MMKKLRQFIGRIFLIIVVLLPYFLEPMTANAKEAQTLAELRVQLKNLEAEKTKTANSKQRTQSQIKANQNAIYQASQDITKAETDISDAEEEIVLSNAKIESTKAEMEELLRYSQVLESSNAYVEYISGASSLTDMVMRIKAVEQIADYNQEKLKNLEELIEYNRQLKIDLRNKQKDLKVKISNYEKSIDSLGDDLTKLTEFADDINAQIKNQKNLIQSYVDMGCKENQLLSECVSISNNGGWRKPLKRGLTTSPWGYRISPLNGVRKFHHGIDIGGNGEGTSVYAAASGTVAAITVKSRCGGNIVYIHSYVNGKPYTHFYAHLLNYAVKVGDKVTTETVIGHVGGGKKSTWDRCSTGAHLHFGISNGFYLGGGSGSYYSYNTFVAKSVQPPGFPKKGSWFYVR